ncbi:hypothetical protein PILCRDRAFT_810943 [Piloderma croceum F 1598]|uniref:Uncharacterized protein n=1 Tax=Piloderma croceum (strain F 1598) TaxID=765440 RepID=A0A0C3GMC6_PILCF|nr:hypothetical protein PILCRDRAFT_810943 [Piloderma croceum F 1598]
MATAQPRAARRLGTRYSPIQQLDRENKLDQDDPRIPISPPNEHPFGIDADIPTAAPVRVADLRITLSFNYVSIIDAVKSDDEKLA